MTISIRLIQEVCAKHYGVQPLDLVSGATRGEVASARRRALTLSRRLTSHTYAVIGGAFGDRDSSTVRVAIDQMEARALNDPEVAEELLTLEIACAAAAALRERSGTLMPDIDAYAVARAVVAYPRVAVTLSIDEIRALALALLTAPEPAADNEVAA
jgi:hypothetical protein